VARHLAEGGFTNTQSAWWQTPSSILACFENVNPSVCDWYRIGDATLGIESDDSTLRERFRRIYGECLSRCPPSTGVRLHCRVQRKGGVPAHCVTFTGPGETTLVDFMLDLFRDRGYVELNVPAPEWRAIGLEGRCNPILISEGNRLLVDEAEPWQPLIANCAVDWAMSIQPDVLFFHAATVGIGDAGVLIVGAKGAGKTTLSMALASRGQDFLGDEIAAVRTRTNELLPMRRAVSIRPGLRAATVEQRLRDREYPAEKFPDGSSRVRVEPGEFFPSTRERSLRLRSIFFLRGFEDRARVEAFVPGVDHLKLLAPLRCCYSGASPAGPLMRVAKLLSSVHCYHLCPGMPDETAILVERIARM
jgi:hypothetical protein